MAHRASCDAPRIRIEQTFDVTAAPDSVFDYMTNPFEQLVEFTRFERPRLLHTHSVEGPQPIDGTWELTPTASGTQVRFIAEGPLHGPMRLLAPLVQRAVDRQFREYHDNLRRNVEAQG